MLLILSSCQEDKEAIINILQTEYSKPEYKLKGLEYGSQKVSIEGYIHTYFEPALMERNTLGIETQRVLDALTLNGLIEVQIVSENKFNLKGEGHSTTKEYKTTITDEGKKYLIGTGRTTTDWVFNVFDLDEIEIKYINKRRDTIFVGYNFVKLNKTKAYGCIPSGLQEYPCFRVNIKKPLSAKFVKKNSELVLVDFDKLPANPFDN